MKEIIMLTREGCSFCFLPFPPVENKHRVYATSGAGVSVPAQRVTEVACSMSFSKGEIKNNE